MKASKKEVGSTCWPSPEKPSSLLLELLLDGPLSKKFNKERTSLDEKVLALRREKVCKPTIFVGMGTCGLGAGVKKVSDAVREYFHKKGMDADIVSVGCIGLCSEEPIMDVQLVGKARISFGKVSSENVASIIDGAIRGSMPDKFVLGQFRSDNLEPWDSVPFIDDHPFLKRQRRIVLAGCGIIDPLSIDEYIARGGYSSLAFALKELKSGAVCEIIERSGLRGRGGAGFPTGKKWLLARKAKGDEKYLICNADEGDPGAFMDRAVGESDPHRLLEGIIIAAYAIGATKAYIYIRAEYPLAVQNLTEAIFKAKEYGLLGTDILKSGFGLEVVIKKGAGAFVCGEETALIGSVEGKRGMPRPRPPFPAVKGLFDKPTIINNVETLANVPGILGMGAEKFAAIGTDRCKGTKVFALSGMVARTGLVEIPMGTPIRDIVFTIGGGAPRGKRCKGVQIGGPSGGCIPEEHMDVATDYEVLKEFGAIMGSGGMVVLDESTCVVDLAKYFMEFIQNESCGKCIPCREGTRRILEILESITKSRKNEIGTKDALLRFQGVVHLRKLAEVIKDSSLCGLGQTAPNPILSTLRWFRDEYEAHVFERRCPAGSCKELVGAPCANGCPLGTEVWRYVAHIARGENKDAYRVIRQANPFPSACARVCHHPCEDMCRCGATGGEPIAVRTLKRFIVEHVAPSTYSVNIKPASKNLPKVAVIGAGPSGLAAAHSLSVLGYRVAIFEKEAKPGGMMVCAIPKYRLPRKVLFRDIEGLLNENIELKLGVELGREIAIDGLLAEGYQAVYLALGCHKSLRLGVSGEGVDGIYSGLDFLKSFNLRGEALARGRVGIIGGGNSAVDAARVALRQQDVRDVTIFYRRSQDEMLAYAEEIEGAIEEGVKIVPLVSPVKVLSEKGKLTGVEFIRNVLGDIDSSGRQWPVEVLGSEYSEEIDTLIVAISEGPDTENISGVDLSKDGRILVDAESLMTKRVGVFGGGDVVRGPNTVVGAIADGKHAAMMMDRYLTGRQMKLMSKVKLPTVYIEPPGTLEIDEHFAQDRIRPPLLPFSDRRGNSKEVELCVSEESAVLEARRCLRCDMDFTHPTNTDLS